MSDKVYDMCQTRCPPPTRRVYSDRLDLIHLACLHRVSLDELNALKFTDRELQRLDYLIPDFFENSLTLDEDEEEEHEGEEDHDVLEEGYQDIVDEGPLAVEEKHIIRILEIGRTRMIWRIWKLIAHQILEHCPAAGLGENVEKFRKILDKHGIKLDKNSKHGVKLDKKIKHEINNFDRFLETDRLLETFDKSQLLLPVGHITDGGASLSLEDVAQTQEDVSSTNTGRHTGARQSLDGEHKKEEKEPLVHTTILGQQPDDFFLQSEDLLSLHPLITDLYWLTHVLLYHEKSGSFSFAHIQCVREKGEKCDPVSLWDGRDEEVIEASRELENITPLVALWLDSTSENGSTSEKFSGKSSGKISSSPNNDKNARLLLAKQTAAKDTLGEVVICLRHFFGLHHPLAEVLGVGKVASLKDDVSPPLAKAFCKGCDTWKFFTYIALHTLNT